MQQPSLWGDCVAPSSPVARPKSRKTNRTQHRRQDWEDDYDPTFQATVALPIVPDDVFAAVPKAILPTVRKYAQRFHLPITLPDPCSEEVDRAIRQAVYALRHANRLRLKMPEDALSRDPDYPTAIERICRSYREEMLAARGLRSAAHGISRVDPKDPSRGYRCQAWGEIGGKTVQGIRVGHIHIGYAKDEETAYRLVAAWWLKNRRIDISICYQPDSAIAALAEMMRDAAINAGNEREYAEMTAAQVWGDEEED